MSLAFLSNAVNFQPTRARDQISDAAHGRPPHLRLMPQPHFSRLVQTYKNFGDTRANSRQLSQAPSPTLQLAGPRHMRLRLPWKFGKDWRCASGAKVISWNRLIIDQTCEGALSSDTHTHLLCCFVFMKLIRSRSRPNTFSTTIWMSCLDNVNARQ